MANSLFAKGREAFLEGSIAALSDTLKLSLLTTTYTPNLSTDQFYGIAVPGGAITAAGVTLTSVTGAAGTLSAANVTFTSVSGTASSYLCLYKDTGVANTSPLIGLIDTATGLPVTPNGGNIVVAWSGGQIFTLRERMGERERAKIERWLAQRWAELGRYLGWGRDHGSGLWLPGTTRIEVPVMG